MYRFKHAWRDGTHAVVLDPLDLIARLEPGTASPGNTKSSNWHPWAWLLQRVFAVDVMTCPRCRGAMKLFESANGREAIARVLANAGLGPRPPPRPLDLSLSSRSTPAPRTRVSRILGPIRKP